MEDIVVLAVIGVAAAFAVIMTIRRFGGRGGCCGGGGGRPKRKRLKKVLYRKSLRVGGMHCRQCRIRVEEAINDIPGAAGRVDLRRGEVTVLSDREIPDERIREKIRRAGYFPQE